MSQNIAGSRSHGPSGDDLYRDAQAEQAGREWRDRSGYIASVLATAQEIEAERVRVRKLKGTVVCCYCGFREVPEDNECGRCGALRERKTV